MSTNPIIGQGWGFPVLFQSPDLGVNLVSGHEDIRQSLHILLGTALGERAMRPEWGSVLASYLFMEMTTDNLSYLSEQVADAINRNERRIELHGVDVDTSMATAGMLLIQINYTVRATNTRDNMVYPFYLQENRI